MVLRTVALVQVPLARILIAIGIVKRLAEPLQVSIDKREHTQARNAAAHTACANKVGACTVLSVRPWQIEPTTERDTTQESDC